MVITNIRILFVFFDSVEPIIFVWSNISEIKYAKAKPIIGFKTVISQYEDIVVQLIGAAADKSIMEMNKMKSLVDPIVKSKVKGPANGAVVKSESAASHSKTQNILQRNAQQHEHQKQLDQQRKKLLEADKLLYKQFHELVEETKVISENDFWDSHSAYLEEWCSTVATASAVARGKGNYLLADILQKNSDGKMVVSLTPEKKQNIFLMYPEIFHAFEAEVPLRMSEAEFWRRYFENEYYNNSGNISIPMDSKDGQPLGFRPKDDLFTRYATKEDDIKPDPTSSSSSNRGNNMSNLPTHQKRLVGIAHSDVDLTASFADHKESFSSAEVVIEEPLGPGNNDEVLATAAGVALRAAQLATKYNKNSSIVVGQGGGGSASSSSNSSNPFDTSLHELEDIRKPSYIPISLNRGDIIDKKGVLPSAQGHAEANKDDNSNESSAFAVSHRRIKRSVDDLKVIKNEENNFDRNIQQPNAHSNSLQLVLGSLLEVDAEKARKLFHSELTKVKKAVGSAFFGDLGGKRKQEESSGPIDDLTAEDTSKEQIPEQFKQVQFFNSD